MYIAINRILLSRCHHVLLLKSVSINEFLKPAEGEEYYGQGGRRGGRGGGRSRGDRGGFRGGYRNTHEVVSAPRIADPGHFPTLGGQ